MASDAPEDGGEEGCGWIEFVFLSKPERLYTARNDYLRCIRKGPQTPQRTQPQSDDEEDSLPGSKPLASDSHPPPNHFLKGALWSPDGSCLLTNCEDNTMRVYDLPPDCVECDPRPEEDFGAALQIEEGETVYDYKWYVGMRAGDPGSCCFATTLRAHPIHLWDALTGKLRATYRAYDHLDEITAAYSLAFGLDGSSVVAGYNKTLRVFDL